MAIVQIDHDCVAQRCDACAFERTLGLDTIEIGVVPDADGRLDVDGVDRADPVIALPSCNRCGAVEVLRLDDDGTSEATADLAVLWRYLGGQPFELETLIAEPSTDDNDGDEAASD